MRCTKQHPCSPLQLSGRKPWCKAPAYLGCAPLSSAPRGEVITQRFLFGWKSWGGFSGASWNSGTWNFSCYVNITENKAMVNVALKHVRGVWNASATLTDENKKGGLCSSEPAWLNSNGWILMLPQAPQPHLLFIEKPGFYFVFGHLQTTAKIAFILCWTEQDIVYRGYFGKRHCSYKVIEEGYWRVLALTDFFIPVPWGNEIHAMKLSVSVCPSPSPLIPLITLELIDQLQLSLTGEGVSKISNSCIPHESRQPSRGDSL